MKLTEQSIKGLKAKPGERLAVSDQACPGLTMRVTDKGVKSWSLKFRSPTDGTPQRLTLGRYPAMSLQAARRAANAYRENREQGRDPKQVAREEKRRAGGGKPFDDIADLFLTSGKKGGKGLRAQATTDQYEAMLKREGGPRELWGTWAIGTITRADVATYLRTVDKRGPIASNRAQAMLQALFGLAEREGEIETNPVAGMGKRNPEQIRVRVLDDKELGAVWRELSNDDSANGLLIRLALKLIVLTGCRVSEVSDMPHAEIKPKAGLWIIPPERTKNGLQLRVPLIPQIDATIKAATAHVTGVHGKRTEWVFPASGLFDRPTSRYALRDACAAIGTRLKITSFSPHDLRRTWTRMALQLRTPPHIVDAQLGHKHGQGGASAMMRTPALSGAFGNYAADFDYLDERTGALRKVAGHVEDTALD